MEHCEECDKTVDERSLQRIDNRFICLNCEDTVTENLQDQIDELLTFEHFDWII
jgi:recombinational DNA repair protein (RecF pathway)